MERDPSLGGRKQLDAMTIHSVRDAISMVPNPQLCAKLKESFLQSASVVEQAGVLVPPSSLRDLRTHYLLETLERVALSLTADEVSQLRSALNLIFPTITHQDWRRLKSLAHPE